MIVGSYCSRILCFSRLMKTAATRVRSSGLAVSFSINDARMTTCSGVLSGRSGECRSQPLLRRLHALNDLLAADAARVIIGVGQQAALARDFLDVAGEDVVLQQSCDDLLGGQTFGKADLMRDDLAIDDGRNDV